MHGGVRRKPAPRLGELTFAAHPVVSARLIPGDRDVHESLEEVALCGRRHAPGFLERLVGREVLPPGNEIETSLVSFVDGASSFAHRPNASR